jgi:hypothetical protein
MYTLREKRRLLVANAGNTYCDYCILKGYISYSYFVNFCDTLLCSYAIQVYLPPILKAFRHMVVLWFQQHIRFVKNSKSYERYQILCYTNADVFL